MAHPLPEVLLLVVCGTISDCDDYDGIAEWGEAHLPFLRRYLPYHHGVPGGRWLTMLMNRIDPALFSAAFTAWVRETWPDRPDFVAIDGKTSRRSHDRSAGKAPLHLVSAFATTARLVLGQEAVGDKSNETTAIPVLLERLAANDGLKGALVSIDAIATNAAIATAIRDAGADYLLAVKANQPTPARRDRSLLRRCPADDLDAPATSTRPMAASRSAPSPSPRGRLARRRAPLSRRTAPAGRRHHRAGRSRTELKDRCRFDTRYFIASAMLTAAGAALAVRGHWGIENPLHWILDVVFNDDLSRLRKGHGAHNMAIVRHFAINLVRAVDDKRCIKLRRKSADGTQTTRQILNPLTR